MMCCGVEGDPKIKKVRLAINQGFSFIKVDNVFGLGRILHFGVYSYVVRPMEIEWLV